MHTQLSELARLVAGELIGDPALSVSGAATLATAQQDEISLADGPDRKKELSESRAAAVVVPQGVEVEDRPSITVDDVHVAFAKIVCHFHPQREPERIGISDRALISESAQLGDDVDVHPNAVIEEDVVIGAGSTVHAGVKIMAGCQIGAGVTIFPNVVLYENTIIGDGCIIHAGAVIGAYGFGYDTKDGRHILSAQLGIVEIGNDVEIGACSTIDRGTYGPTKIGDGTKIDNLVQIAHNCRIGRHNLLCSQVGIAGSTTTDDYVVLGGQVGVRDHAHIGQGAMLGAMSGVMNDIPAGEYWLGVPATPGREQMYKQGALSKLPEMRKELKKLQKAVQQLTDSKSALDPPAAA